MEKKLILVILMIISVTTTFAATTYIQGHPANQVRTGPFQGGAYSFPGSLGVGTNGPKRTLQVGDFYTPNVETKFSIRGGEKYINTMGFWTPTEYIFSTGGDSGRRLILSGKWGNIMNPNPSALEQQGDYSILEFDATNYMKFNGRQVILNGKNTMDLNLRSNVTSNNGAENPWIQFQKSRDNDGDVQKDDKLGAIFFGGMAGDNSGAEFGGGTVHQILYSAGIQAVVDSATGDNKVPTALVFGTSPNGVYRGDIGMQERMRISSAGDLIIRSSVDHPSDPGDIIFQEANFNNYPLVFTQKARIWSNPVAGAGLSLSSGDNNADITIDANGNVWTRSASDIRLKKNILPLTGALDKVEQLNGVYFNWKNPDVEQSTQIGLIAQDVEKVLPELVDEDSNGIKSVDYNKMVPVLVEAIKELKKDNEALKERIDELESN